MNTDQIAWLIIGLIALSTLLCVFSLIFVSHLYNRRERLNDFNFGHERMVKEHGVDQDLRRERMLHELQDDRMKKLNAGANIKKGEPDLGPGYGGHI